MSNHIEMGINPEEFEAVEQQPKYYHEELHAPDPEGRDTGVETWFHRKEQLPDYDLGELQAVDQQLQALPEMRQYQKERVRIENIEQLLSDAHTFSPNGGFEKIEGSFTDLLSNLRTQMDRYAASLRQFHLSEVARFHLDPERYRTMMKNADEQRRSSHNALLADFKILSRFLTQRIPKAAGSEFNEQGWEDHIRKKWFSLDQLNDRKYLGEWSIKTHIVEKARAVHDAIQQTIEKKSAETD